MGNGVETGSDVPRLEEMETAAEDENLRAGLTNGDAYVLEEGKDVPKDSEVEVKMTDLEEDDVFEEAMDDSNLQQQQDDPSEDSQVIVAVNGDEFGEKVPGENGKPGLDHGPKKLDEATDVQVEDQTPQKEEEAMVHEEKDGASHVLGVVQEEEAGKEAVLTNVNGMERDDMAVNGEVDVVECSSVPVDGGESEFKDDKLQDTEEKLENGDFDANEAPTFVHEESENGNFSEVIVDERDTPLTLNGGIAHQDVLHQIQEASIVMDSTFDRETEGLLSEHVEPLHVPTERDDVVQTDTCAPEMKVGESSQSHVVAQIVDQKTKIEEEKPSSDESRVFEQESVTVEDLGESNSSDEDENRASVQPPPAAAPSPKRSSGPPLPSQPAGLGSSAPLLEPAHRSLQPPRANGSVPQRQSQQLSEDTINGDVEENDETREKLQMIRVKFLRLAHRLGQTPHNVVVAQVLYRLGLAEQLRGSRNTNRASAFSFDRASAMAEQLEATGQEPLDFSCTIMVIGKTGVGKSATINSIFDEVKFNTDAFQSGSKKVQDVVGMVQGIKVRVIDTPGLSSSSIDQRKNEKILHSVKHFIKKNPPDIVLYLDRLDLQSRDYGDVPLLHTITDIFGASIWFNTIVVLTHAASAPPEGMNGTPLSYEMFVTQRSHVVQQAIRQAAGDLRLMNPVSLVENHSACRMNRAGQRVLPNGQVWKPQLLLLSFASKILAEANTLLKLQDSPPGKPFGARARVPPLPFLLSSLLQSRPQLKLPEDQFGDDDTMDEDLVDTSDSGDESDYDDLPPFKSLTRAQLAKLTKAQKKAYYQELDYRERLFFKQQLKEEKRHRKLLKKMAAAAAANDLPDNYNDENLEDESSGPATVPVPMPDLALPSSFDSDYPSHRYRFLDSSNQWLVRPVLETQGWDHDVGYEGLNIERSLVVKEKIPVSFSGQLTKDKKECNLQMELASSIKHGEGKATSLGLDMQSVGKDMAYTLRGETRFNNFRRNNTAAGVSVTLLGDSMSAGLKIEDKLIVNRRFRLLISGGAMSGCGDVAYGGRLEATLRDKDYPIGRALSTIALSVVDWHGDLAIGCNVQSQIPVGRGTNLIGHANLSNRGTGQVGIRLNSSEQLQIALVALVPILKNVKRLLFGSSQNV